MKYRKIALTAAAFMMILSAGAGKAWAYFTTYTQASGGGLVQLGNQTHATETVDSWTKHLTISNDSASGPVYVRAKAFSSVYSLEYNGGGSWSPGEEEYYYYNEILPAGGETETLDIHIQNVPGEAKDSESFNVVVVYESVPVCYREDGTPYADWSGKQESGTWEGGGDGQ